MTFTADSHNPQLRWTVTAYGHVEGGISVRGRVVFNSSEDGHSLQQWLLLHKCYASGLLLFFAILAIPANDETDPS